MKRLLLPVLFALFVAAGCSGSSVGEIPSARSSLEQRLAAVVEGAVGAHGIPGAAAGWWVPGRSVPILVTRGVSEVGGMRRVGPTDAFRIGSVTKSFTVEALLQLVDEGKVRLEDPIRLYLPTLQNGSATLEQCANMTSGIFNYSEDESFRSVFFPDFAHVWTETELLDAANRNAPYFPPGGGWHYSNTNTVALGLVVEQVTGNSLDHELQRRFFDPLALAGTQYPSGLAMPFPFARGYGRYDVGGPLKEITDCSPTCSFGSGAIVANLLDLGRWGEALGSGRLLSPASRARQRAMVPATGCSSCPEYDSYGLGMGSLSGWVGHTGDYIGYQALVMYRPETGEVIVILVNLKDFTQPTHVPTAMFRQLVE